MPLDRLELIRLLVLFIVSGGTVVAVSLLSKYGSPKLAGALVFAPIVSLWSYGFIGATQGGEHLRGLVQFSIFAAPAVLVFSIVLFILLGKVSLWLALALSVAAWFGAAFLLLSWFS